MGDAAGGPGRATRGRMNRAQRNALALGNMPPTATAVPRSVLRRTMQDIINRPAAASVPRVGSSSTGRSRTAPRPNVRRTSSSQFERALRRGR